MKNRSAILVVLFVAAIVLGFAGAVALDRPGAAAVPVAETDSTASMGVASEGGDGAGECSEATTLEPAAPPCQPCKQTVACSSPGQACNNQGCICKTCAGVFGCFR